MDETTLFNFDFVPLELRKIPLVDDTCSGGIFGMLGTSIILCVCKMLVSGLCVVMYVDVYVEHY